MEQLPFDSEVARSASFAETLETFRWKEKETERQQTRIAIDDGAGLEIGTFVNEFWTSRQRAAHSLHEISYRACFKPQLPRFFIESLTIPGARVYDPFMGRGTTPLEAALFGRQPVGCDANPLSVALLKPRLDPPTWRDVAERLAKLDFRRYDEQPDDLLVFFHRETLREVCALKRYLLERSRNGLDPVDAWIRMVAVNRLTGHSKGFFSVYTMPPNQAVSIDSQRRINARRQQEPPRRHVAEIILGKTRSLLADCGGSTRRRLADASRQMQLLTTDAADTPSIESDSIDLVVTSPPFLDVVNYANDNWLRCWFCGIDPASVELSVLKHLNDWNAKMTRVFRELHRVLRPAGHIAFEVGEVRGGLVKLEEHVVPAALAARLEPVLIVINRQRFTKTANCWGVSNNVKGTNSNRVVLLRKSR